MDGLLINSEPLWQKAEMVVFKQIGLNLSLEDCLKTTGMPSNYVVKYWHNQVENPPISAHELEQELFVAVKKMLKQEGKPMDGVVQCLQLLSDLHIPCGLASASPIDLIEQSLEVCKLKPYFQFYHSGALEIENKPNPALYHTVAQKLGVNTAQCLILEDSCNGVKGALASGAKVIAVPSQHDYQHTCFDKALLKTPSLVNLL